MFLLSCIIVVNVIAVHHPIQYDPFRSYHSINFAMFDLAKGYKETGMAAYSELQQKEFLAEKDGYTAVRHQREAATGYFDAISNVVTAGRGSTLALKGSTETAQFGNGSHK